MSPVTGLHHVTVIAGDAQENLDFYTGVLGMRLVKRSVNQDSPETYHLFYADGEGHAGTDLTFFPWAGMPRGRPGIGLTNEVSLAVPIGTLEWWQPRLASHSVDARAIAVRFSERVLPFTDPHGLQVTLTETGDEREFTPWADGPVPADKQVRGLHAVRISERELEPTARLLSEGLGFSLVGEEAGWRRYAIGGGGSGRMVDVEETPEIRRGSWGVGSVHHVAFRVPDDAAQLAVQQQVAAMGRHPTEVVDRFWFKSVYFKEPGGALFEVATDGPGFGIDEPTESLGEQLILPPWLEPHRAEIEAGLPVLT